MDREKIGGQIEEFEASVAKLKITVNELRTQNQHLRDQIERLARESSASKKELHSKIDEQKQELQTTHAQIRGYNTQSDSLRKERDDLKLRLQRTEELLQQTLQESQDKVCPFVLWINFDGCSGSNVVVLVKKYSVQDLAKVTRF